MNLRDEAVALGLVEKFTVAMGSTGTETGHRITKLAEEKYGLVSKLVSRGGDAVHGYLHEKLAAHYRAKNPGMQIAKEHRLPDGHFVDILVGDLPVEVNVSNAPEAERENLVKNVAAFGKCLLISNNQLKLEAIRNRLDPEVRQKVAFKLVYQALND